MRILYLILTLVALPLAAQSWEAGLFLGQQSFGTYRLSWTDAKPDSKTIGALRGGYDLLAFGSGSFQVSVAFQPKTSTKRPATSTAGPYGSDFNISLDQSAMAIGTAFVFRGSVSASLGVDCRWDRLSASGSTPLNFYYREWSATGTYARPWVRANLGYAFSAPGLKPFLCLEVASILGSKTVDATGTLGPDAFLKAMAPTQQIGLYGGVRF